MITTNAIQRTFHIKRGDATGTAFAIDRASRQYLETARHVVDGIAPGDTIAVFHENQWKNVTVDVVGIGKGDVDVAVLSCPVQLAPTYPLEASAAGLAYGQNVYFLGFPFGWDGGAENMNRDFPMPFVKTGIISTLIFGDPTRFFIDGHGNRDSAAARLSLHQMVSLRLNSGWRALSQTTRRRYGSPSSINEGILSSTTTVNLLPFSARIRAWS